MVLHFLLSTVSFPVILLFWALSLSPVWPNIECRQDLGYKTNFLNFYSENNSDSLNRPPSTNLIVVQCVATLGRAPVLKGSCFPNPVWVPWQIWFQGCGADI